MPTGFKYMLRFKLVLAMREYRLRELASGIVLSCAADSSPTHHALRDNRWWHGVGASIPPTPRERAHMAVIRIMGDRWAARPIRFEFVPVDRWRREGRVPITKQRAGLWIMRP